VEREVRGLVDQHQAEWRAMRMPPLSGEDLARLVEVFRQKVAVSAPTSTSWPDISDLQDKVRAAEDALERAKADYASLARRDTTVAVAQAPAA
jgi:hypothetical protein